TPKNRVRILKKSLNKINIKVSVIGKATFSLNRFIQSLSSLKKYTFYILHSNLSIYMVKSCIILHSELSNIHSSLIDKDISSLPVKDDNILISPSRSTDL